MDGYHAGMMSKRFQQIFADPDAALRAPPPVEVDAPAGT